MEQGRGDNGARPLGSSTTSTTTTRGPHTHTTTTTYSTSPQHGTSVIDYSPQTTTVTSPTITTTTHTPYLQAPAPAASPERTRPRSSSIRIRKPVPQHVAPEPTPSPPPPQPTAESNWQAGRRRSSSEPRPLAPSLLQDDSDLRRQVTATPLQPLYEEGARAGNPNFLAPGTGPPPARGPSTRRQTMQRQASAITMRRKDHNQTDQNMEANMVDVLDVIGQYLHHLAPRPS